MKRLILLIIVVGVLAAAGLAAWTYSNLHKPITHSKKGQYIDIPKGTSPSAIVNKLATAQKEIAAEASTQNRFLAAGARLFSSTPIEAAAFAAKETVMWREVVRLSGLTPQ